MTKQIEPYGTEEIRSLIVKVRGQTVILDADLAAIYGVKTKALNQAVKRNSERFPEDFILQLTRSEAEEVRRARSQTVTLKRGQNIKYLPYVFTEHGAVMLASILNSERAVLVYIQIIRIFIRLRQLLETRTEIIQKLEQLEKNDIEQDQKISRIFEYFRQLEQARQQKEEHANRKSIGFKRND